MASPVRILIVGTGGMARTHAQAYAHIEHADVVAGVDNRDDALAAFCDEFGIGQRFHSLQHALDWGEFDAVSNVTPDGVHHRTTLPCIAASKHVLCEKPLATCYADAKQMAELAEDAGIVHCINLSYRQVPALQQAAAMVADGVLGEIRHFEASYLQSWLTQPAWGDWKTESQWLWRLSSKHGSNGVLGDVGIHILDFATFIAGSLPVSLSSRLKTFDKAPGNKIDEYELDANDSFVLHAELANGALGTIAATRFASGHHNDLRLRIYGDKGGLDVRFEKATSQLHACLGHDLETAQWEEIKAIPVPNNYQRFVSAILDNTRADPDFVRGAQLQKLLDAAMVGAME